MYVDGVLKACWQGIRQGVLVTDRYVFTCKSQNRSHLDDLKDVLKRKSLGFDIQYPSYHAYMGYEVAAGKMELIERRQYRFGVPLDLSD
jgi:hypothetical protein